MFHPLRLLVVDPRDQEVAAYAHAFASRGWLMDRAKTFLEALDLLENSFYHAAIVELMLPDLMGTEAWSHFRALQPSLVGIVTTTSPSLHETIQITDGSIIGYLLKPLDLDQVCGLITTAAREQPEVLPPRLDQQLVGLGALLAILTQVSAPQQIMATIFAKSPALFKLDWILAYLSRPGQAGWSTYSYSPPSSPKELTAPQSQFVEHWVEKATGSQGFVVLDHSTASPEDKTALDEVGLRGLVAVPLTVQNCTYGALVVASSKCDQCFTMIDIELLTAVSRVAALALHNSRLSERLRQEAILDPSLEVYSRAYLDHMIELEKGKRERHYPRRYSMIRIGWKGSPEDADTDPIALKKLGVIAQVARQQVRASDVVARHLGGLAVMLAETDDPSAQLVADRLQAAIEEGMGHRRGDPPILTSVVVGWDQPAQGDSDQAPARAGAHLRAACSGE